MDEIVTDNDGARRWYKDDLLHREGGPAVEEPDGTRRWYKDGRLHREDGPAIERADGTREWWVDGKVAGIRSSMCPPPDDGQQQGQAEPEPWIPPKLKGDQQ